MSNVAEVKTEVSSPKVKKVSGYLKFCRANPEMENKRAVWKAYTKEEQKGWENAEDVGASPSKPKTVSSVTWAHIFYEENPNLKAKREAKNLHPSG